MTTRNFESPDELAIWLAAAGIDTTHWGSGQSKRLADLWLEYTNGESAFTAEPPTREVTVVQVIIRRGEATLVELAQEMVDGRRRIRMRPPSEKVKPGETARSAALRCLREELDLAAGEVMMETEGVDFERVEDSPSYPGLPTRYRFYRFHAAAAGLPDEDFTRENVDDGDPIRRHQWGWRKR